MHLYTWMLKSPREFESPGIEILTPNTVYPGTVAVLATDASGGVPCYAENIDEPGLVVSVVKNHHCKVTACTGQFTTGNQLVQIFADLQVRH